MRLGEGRFQFALEALPSERVIWEGGPSPRATWLRALRWLLATVAVWLIPLALFTLIAVAPPRPRAPRAGESTTAQEKLSESELALRRQRAEEAKRRALKMLYGGSAIGVSGLGVVFFLMSAQRTRNSWYVVTSERICIQSGGGERQLLVVDLDKVLSVRASAAWLDRVYGLEHVEIATAAVILQRGGSALTRGEQSVLGYVPASAELLSKLTNDWLPRDNRR